MINVQMILDKLNEMPEGEKKRNIELTLSQISKIKIDPDLIVFFRFCDEVELALKQDFKDEVDRITYIKVNDSHELWVDVDSDLNIPKVQEHILNIMNRFNKTFTVKVFTFGNVLDNYSDYKMLYDKQKED